MHHCDHYDTEDKGSLFMHCHLGGKSLQPPGRCASCSQTQVYIEIATAKNLVLKIKLKLMPHSKKTAPPTPQMSHTHELRRNKHTVKEAIHIFLHVVNLTLCLSIEVLKMQIFN